ncbi:Rtf2 RING-finger-domain-containing protein [Cristinia sonorae]|uniref:Rtf2 RING-finger-domain-containing protein n=1 Tax=Cristinia sonorae TaxID=1940300 RepID=A0A8K0UPV7_9AGAR|nr:Rtf2 RING-finger-domain-containing protein [Cristinia sonorae]
MGNDGGSIPDRRDLVRNKPKAEQADKANQLRAAWFFCALSKKPLQEPIVSCPLGKLYNKDAILEYLLDKTAYGDGEEICGHIRSLKDVKTLKLSHNASRTGSPSSDPASGPAPFVCPLNLKEMNGVQPFVYLVPCGCVFSQAGLKAVSRSPAPREGALDDNAKGKDKDIEDTGKQLEVCPQCATKYDKAEGVLQLNPPPEEAERMRAAMDRKRASELAKGKGKKRKAAAADGEPPAKKVVTPTVNPNIVTSRAVANSLAEEEAKRKAKMSDAVKSLYTPKNAENKETFMTRGTFNRVCLSIHLDYYPISHLFSQYA